MELLASGIAVLLILSGFTDGDTGCSLWLLAFVLFILGVLILGS